MFMLQRFSAKLMTYEEYTANFFNASNSQTDTKIKSISIGDTELIIHKNDGTEENFVNGNDSTTYMIPTLKF